MLPALALALLAVPQDASPVLKRMDAFFAKHPTFEAKLNFEMSNGEKGEGTLYENRPSKIAYLIKFKNGVYQFARTPRGAIETSSLHKAYDEYPSEGTIDIPLSDFTTHEWRLAWPLPLFMLNIDDYFPVSPKIALEGQSKLNGATVDVVSISLNSHHMRYEASMSVDAAGKIVQYTTTDPANRYTVKINVTDYKLDKLPSNAFKLETLPFGYTLQELPAPRNPLGWDHKLPSTMVFDASGEKHPLGALVGKSGMLAVVDAAWTQSPWGKQALREIRGVLESEKAGNLVLLNDTPGKGGAKGGLVADPTGEALTTLSIPASPTFFLINKQGVIERIWCGYNPDNDRFLPEVREAIEKPGESRPER